MIDENFERMEATLKDLSYENFRKLHERLDLKNLPNQSK